MRIKLTVDNRIKVNDYLEPVRSDKFWKYAATQWHRLYKDFVPMKSGALYRRVTIEPKIITHTAPYAHYAYTGRVYGPNIPVVKGDRITGYFSQPNRPKKPTGKALQFSKQFHPKASAKWDQAAKPTQMPKLVNELQRYIDSGRLGK